MTAGGSFGWTAYGAVLFDLDGVLTPTAKVHRAAWADLFTNFLASDDAPKGARPYQEQDYFDYIDGKPRYDGVRDFLASRDITLPEGSPDDPPDAVTVCGLGNRKNTEFNAVLKRDGVKPYPGSVALLDTLGEMGMPMAVVSSSANANAVLQAAGIADRFVTVVDARVAMAKDLPGKPAPDTFSYAAEVCGVTNLQSVVVEDALAGVEAGATGGFGAVIGVDRGVGAPALTAAGATVVVTGLEELA